MTNIEMRILCTVRNYAFIPMDRLHDAVCNDLIHGPEEDWYIPPADFEVAVARLVRLRYLRVFPFYHSSRGDVLIVATKGQVWLERAKSKYVIRMAEIGGWR